MRGGENAWGKGLSLIHISYPELLDTANKVLAAIKANRQGANKNLRAMTEPVSYTHLIFVVLAQGVKTR